MVKSLAYKGFETLANVRCSGRKSSVSQYGISNEGIFLKHLVTSDRQVLLSQLEFSTNDTFIVESFLPYNSDVTIIVKKPNTVLQNPVTLQETKGFTQKDGTLFSLNLPH